MNIFPIPIYGGVQRVKQWGANIVRYDSGMRQADTAFLKPLYDYQMTIPYMNEFRQSSLWHFIDLQRSETDPFLMKDPYDYIVNSVFAVRSGLTTGSMFLFDTNSYMVRADTTTIGSLFSSLSAYVKLGTNYTYDQGTGILTLTTKASTDVWGVRSMQYFKKCAFKDTYTEQSPSWNIFGGTLSIEEIP